MTSEGEAVRQYNRNVGLNDPSTWRSSTRMDEGKVLRCTGYGFTGDRGVVACVNLFQEDTGFMGLGVSLDVPKGDANPKPMRENHR
ncbi:MAG: hypothetical protein QW816_06485 [Desulfurococcaceae archaeon]